MNQQRSEIADEVIAVVSTRFGLLSTGPASAISPFAVSNKREPSQSTGDGFFSEFADG